MSKYQYTCGNSILTKEQRDFYEENGYIVFRNLIPDAILDECKEHFLEICNGGDSSGVAAIIEDESLAETSAKGEFLINKLQDFLNDEILFKYAAYSKIVDIISDIIGPNITAVNSMLINKPPGADVKLSRNPLHQDLYYFPFRPANRIVASWTAMEPVHERNGCLFVVPGTHKGDLYNHRYPDDGSSFLYYGLQGFDLVQKRYLPMDKGDTVFFHPLLFHGSGPNLTKGFRKAISCHYADSKCNTINVSGTIQESVAKELQSVLAKRGIFVSYVDIWKLKSRLIKGLPGKFQSMDSKL